MALIININGLIITIVIIILQVIGIYTVIKIGKMLGKSNFWLLITIALSLTFIRRIISLLEIFNIVSRNKFLDNIDLYYFPIIFWLFMIFGMLNLKKRIELNENIKKTNNTKINKRKKH